MGGLFYLLGEFPLIVRCHLISMLFLMMLTSHNFMCYSYLRHSHSFLDSFGKKRRATNSLPCCVIPYSSNGSLNLLHASDTLKILFTIQLPSSLLALGNGHIGWNLDFICSQFNIHQAFNAWCASKEGLWISFSYASRLEAS